MTGRVALLHPLDRDLAPDLLVHRTEDLAHAAATDLRSEPVAFAGATTERPPHLRNVTFDRRGGLARIGGFAVDLVVVAHGPIVQALAAPDHADARITSSAWTASVMAARLTRRVPQSPDRRSRRSESARATPARPGSRPESRNPGDRAPGAPASDRVDDDHVGSAPRRIARDDPGPELARPRARRPLREIEQCLRDCETTTSFPPQAWYRDRQGRTAKGSHRTSRLPSHRLRFGLADIGSLEGMDTIAA
jgi:hypothetical protein